jgi:hypothetical protein
VDAKSDDGQHHPQQRHEVGAPTVAAEQWAKAAGQVAGQRVVEDVTGGAGGDD